MAQSLAATALGAVALVGLGGAGGWAGGVVYGLALSVASTVVLTRVMADHDELHTPTGHVAVGWTIVEDLLTVLMLVLLPAIFAGQSNVSPGGLPLAVGIALLKVALLFLITFLLGGRFIPWLLRQVAATRSRELFTLTILVVALGIAYGSSRLFGVSMGLGAFLAGMIVGRSDFSLRAASEALPMRDAFAVLFFVSVGMLFDFRAVIETPWLALATVAIIVAGKPLVSLGLVLALGQPMRTALSVALSLGQIGEFSFILAAMGNALGVLPHGATSVLVAASIVSIAVSPLLHRFDRAPRLLDAAHAAALSRAARLRRRRRALPAAGGGALPCRGDRLRAGRSDGGASPREERDRLDDRGAEPPDGAPPAPGGRGRRARRRGPSRNPRERRACSAAGSLILSASGIGGDSEIIRLAREMNPDIRILARSAYLRERPPLLAAGADAVFSGEGEVALAMTEAILRDLGATPEQIDRERENLLGDTRG